MFIKFSVALLATFEAAKNLHTPWTWLLWATLIFSGFRVPASFLFREPTAISEITKWRLAIMKWRSSNCIQLLSLAPDSFQFCFVTIVFFRAAHEAMPLLQRGAGGIQEGPNSALRIGHLGHRCGSRALSDAPAVHCSGDWSFGGVGCMALEWLDPVISLQGLGSCPDGMNLIARSCNS